MTHSHVPWLIHVWHDSLEPGSHQRTWLTSYAPWLIHVCHDSFILPWHITHVWHDSLEPGSHQRTWLLWDARARLSWPRLQTTARYYSFQYEWLISWDMTLLNDSFKWLFHDSFKEPCPMILLKESYHGTWLFKRVMKESFKRVI